MRPFILIWPSTISLVVPAISVTIALSSCNNAFNNELFPTFGLPIIDVFIPSLINSPLSIIAFLSSGLILSAEAICFSKSSVFKPAPWASAKAIP